MKFYQFVLPLALLQMPEVDALLESVTSKYSQNKFKQSKE